MSGGMYVISRSWFNDLGGYDLGMDVWGAENLEMSFRVSSRFKKSTDCAFCLCYFTIASSDFLLINCSCNER